MIQSKKGKAQKDSRDKEIGASKPESSPVKLLRKAMTQITGEIQSDSSGEIEKMKGSNRSVELPNPEDVIRESEERYRTLVETCPDAITMIDLTGRMIMANQQAAQFYGCKSPAEMLELGHSAFDMVHPEDQARAVENTKKTLEFGSVRNIEYRLMRKDGSHYPVELSASVLRDPKGNPKAFIGVIRDITQRKHAEEALRESEQRYRILFEDSPVALLELDLSEFKTKVAPLIEKTPEEIVDFFIKHPSFLYEAIRLIQVVDLNKTTVSLFGAESKGHFTTHTFDLMREDNFETYKNLLCEMIKGKTASGSEIKIKTLRGEDRTVLVRFLIPQAYQQSWSMVLASLADITERKRAEEDRQKLQASLLHGQKLESMGILAGGIAHDFNNLLMGVLGNASLALLELPHRSLSRQYVEKIETAARRAAELTNQMLAYSGKGKFLIHAVDLSRLVEEMSNLLKVSISKKISLRLHLQKSIPAIEADPTQVRQVVMNLITNASEAIGDENGVISIYTGYTELDASYLLETFPNDELTPGPYVYLEVTDTGCGMNKETQAKLFDPFFTTKFTGRGLGLAAVLGIIRGHHGTIKVYSEPSQGTTFKVFFPASSKTAVVIESQSPPTKKIVAKDSLVLVVDDEESVREVTKSMLETSGFQVLTARDGLEGIDIFRKHAEKITAVLLDTTMPHMDGEETFRELRRLKPNVPVILSSGYNEQDVTIRFVGKNLAGFIQKPYQMQKLVAKLQEVLSNSSPKKA